MTYFLGVDLGQAHDFTALCLLEQAHYDTGRRAPGSAVLDPIIWQDGVRLTPESKEPEPVPVYEHSYAVRYLKRLPIGTPYPAQVEWVKKLHDRLKDEGHGLELVVDQTGVGRAVVDMLRDAELAPVAVTITGGDTVSSDGGDYRVPKRDLVSTAQVLLQTGRLKIAKELKEAQTLTSELLAFKVNINLRGHDSYGNDVGPWRRENAHDDLVLAVALAAWWGENKPKPLARPPRRKSIVWQNSF